MKFFVAIVLSGISLLISLGFKSNFNTPKVVTSTSSVHKQSEPPVGLNLGNKAPELALRGVSGQIIKLSSLRGKLVLIDFWASWCGPCRRENPAVVEVYKTYKDKKFVNGDGFTVYGVSLDVEAEAWKKAIEKDDLEWSSHVSDLQGWNSSAVALYGISGIPSNFLVNEKGIIINKNLRGVDLMNALNKLVKPI